MRDCDYDYDYDSVMHDVMNVPHDDSLNHDGTPRREAR